MQLDVEVSPPAIVITVHPTPVNQQNLVFCREQHWSKRFPELVGAQFLMQADRQMDRKRLLRAHRALAQVGSKIALPVLPTAGP